MIKVGDWVEVVGHSAYYSKGDRFRVADLFDEGVVDGNDIAIYKDAVRLVEETEAEKRGAKFGVGGVVKGTGLKWIFVCEVEGYWRGITENCVMISGPPLQFRLDHEPEYKEIPFSEATHEQRMNVDNLVHAGGRKVEQIFRFNNGSYASTCERDEVVYQSTSLVKVRIPT